MVKVRHNFSKATKRAALLRAGGVCEAHGPPYSHGPESRCTVNVGLQADHYPLPAIDEGSDTLDNCVIVCAAHHLFKTRTWDVPLIAKGKRIARANGPFELRRKTKVKIQARNFAKAHWPMQSRPFEKRRES